MYPSSPNARDPPRAATAFWLRRTGRNVLDTLKPKDIEAWGIRYEPAYAARTDEPARDLLARMLRELVELLRDSHTGIALLYDEFPDVWDGRVPRDSVWCSRNPIVASQSAVETHGTCSERGRQRTMLTVTGLRGRAMPGLASARGRCRTHRPLPYL